MLQKIDVTPNTEEWYELRKGGIGCSDIPILTVSEDNPTSYSSPLELFHQKIGLAPIKKRDTQLTFMGHLHEPMILELWQYWENGKEKYIENYQNKNIIRRYKKNTGFVYVNEDLPYMFFTPDGIIPAGEMDLYGNKLEKDCPMNAKNINHLFYNLYNGVSPSIIEQMHGEMSVMGVEYSEIPHLVGGFDFHVEACPYSEVVATSILGICRSFWYDRVVPAKKLVKLMNETSSEKEKAAIMHDIYQLEPLASNGKSERDFLAERFVNMDKKLQATPQLETLMNTYEVLKTYEKFIEQNKRHISNVLLRLHEHHGANRIIGNECTSSNNAKHVIKGDVTNHNANQLVKQEILNFINRKQLN